MGVGKTQKVDQNNGYGNGGQTAQYETSHWAVSERLSSGEIHDWHTSKIPNAGLYDDLDGCQGKNLQ
jgi:hypothetical protein